MVLKPPPAAAFELSDLVTGDASDAAMFSELRRLGLAGALRIMELKIDPKHKDAARLLSIQATVITLMMTTGSKVDPNALRPEQTDKFTEMLASARAKKAALGAVEQA